MNIQSLRALLSLWPVLLLTTSTVSAAPPVKEQAAFARVRGAMQALVKNQTIPGAVTLVGSNERIINLQATGFSDLSQRDKMEPDTLFWIASMTKPVTAVAVLMLQDEGRLNIEDPVEKHLPEFKGHWLVEEKEGDRAVLVKPERPITLRDLLTHTSGMGDPRAPRPRLTLAELVAWYAQQPLEFAPGSKWQYSTAGINVLGRVVEVVSRMKCEEFFQKRIFDPLGMKDTTFWPTPRQAKRLAKSYKPAGEGKLEETGIFLVQGELSDERRTPIPGGGLFSTATDMYRFYQMLLSDGTFKSKRLLSSSAVYLLTTTQTGALKTGFTDGMSWGLGFQVVKEPTGVTAMLSPGTFGHGGAYGTQGWADPKKNLILILMIQRAAFPNADNSPVRMAFQQSAVEAAAKVME
jgi:CubicO group peptidase (beta-lactamase class C family)